MAKGTIRGFIAGVIVTVAVINAPKFVNDVYVDCKISYYTEQANALLSVGADSADHAAHEEYVMYINTIEYLQNK